MSKVSVSQQIEVLEVNGEEVAVNNNLFVGIKSHSIYHNYIILKLGRRRITVEGRALKIAIDNAMNTG